MVKGTKGYTYQPTIPGRRFVLQGIQEGETVENDEGEDEYHSPHGHNNNFE